MPTPRVPRDGRKLRRQDCCGAPIISARAIRPAHSRQRSSWTSSRPGPGTLLALDLEANEGDPSNSMTLEQAEAFVQAVASATGRLPLVYVPPTWANGGARITPDLILARCGLWVADYHASPEIPLAWATSGWRLWQYAGDQYAGHRAHGHNRIVQGLDHCDRNLFNGDVAALYRFWNATA